MTETTNTDNNTDKETTERNPYGHDNDGTYSRAVELDEIYNWMVIGEPYSTPEIAEQFGVKPRTARKYMQEMAPNTPEEIEEGEDENPYPIRKKKMGHRSVVYIRQE